MAPADRVRMGGDRPRSGDATSRTDRDVARVADDAARAADDAARVAVEAARTAGVEVSDLDGPAAMREAAEVFDRTWGRGGQRGSVLPTEALVALAHAGAQVSGARRDGTLVGATAAFLGRTADGRPLLHSHVTAVVPGGEGRAVGRALKWHQRAWCLARDIEQVRWTFDPLIRRNAVFNLIVLGAHATGFEHDVYGPMDDDRNAGVPTDRLRVVWDLLAPRVRSAAAGRAAAPDASALLRAGAIVTLEEGPHGPEARDTNAPRRLVRVPADIEALRRDRPAVADAWTQAYRDVLGGALGSGFRITGATRDGWYVLSADRGVDELAARP